MILDRKVKIVGWLLYFIADRIYLNWLDQYNIFRWIANKNVVCCHFPLAMHKLCRWGSTLSPPIKSGRLLKSRLTSKDCPRTSFNLPPPCLKSLPSAKLLGNSEQKLMKLADSIGKLNLAICPTKTKKTNLPLIATKKDFLLPELRNPKGYPNLTSIVSQHMKIVILSTSIGHFQSSFFRTRKHNCPIVTPNQESPVTSLTVARQWSRN